jgi:hypothetical protein
LLAAESNRRAERHDRAEAQRVGAAEPEQLPG